LEGIVLVLDRQSEFMMDVDELIALFQTMSLGVVYQNEYGKIIQANPAAEKILGLTLDEMMGRTSSDPRWRSIREDGSDFPGEEHPAMVALKTKKKVRNVVMGVYDPKKDANRWINVNAIPQFKDKDKEPYQVYTTFDDITERKNAEKLVEQSLKEKEMLLKEIHHRVKNNLMIISSLLSLQSSYIKDDESRELFQVSEDRARSMALIHESLYESSDLKNIDFGDHIQSLAKELFLNYTDGSGRIKLKIDAENIGMDINTTIPLSLILNELITNSLKHAFPGDRLGEIKIDFHSQNEEYELTVKDDGIGLPHDFDYTRTDSLGLQLINSLTAQIDGRIELKKIKGTTYSIIFPKKRFD
jgi:PAS domain S-box-containing protein